jgi:hypothetical protein
MPSPLQNLEGPGKPLRAEPPDAAEFAGLLRSGRARLIDAAKKGLALESRFDLPACEAVRAKVDALKPP